MMRGFSLWILALVILVPWAVADPFNPFNPRPVTVNPAPPGEVDLQVILNNQCSGCFNVNTDQQSAGYWGLATQPPTGVLPFVIVEYAGFAPNNVVGLFHWTGLAATLLPVFLGPATAGTTASITWTGPSTGTITQISGPSGAVNAVSFNNIPFFAFGFYIQTPQNNTFFSVDDLNPGNAPQVLAFRHLPSNTWFLAFEDLLVGGGSDQDYNDFVLKVESIVPVPEPAAFLLLGSTLVLMGRKLRAKRA
jgi:hypothetical protein